MITNGLVLFCALALTSIPVQVAATSAVGNQEYNKVCPNPQPVEHTFASGYKATYYCDTLPPMTGHAVWNINTIDDCALACNTPECRGVTWERQSGICWKYDKNPNESGGHVWIASNGAFAGQTPCPDPQKCECSAEELKTCNDRLHQCQTAPTDCSRCPCACSAEELRQCRQERDDCLTAPTDCSKCPSQDCTPILKELNEWKTVDGTCESSLVDFFLFSLFTSFSTLCTTCQLQG